MKGHGECQRIASEIDALFEGAEDVEDRLKASLARYACVLASSYVEASCKDVFARYAAARSDGTVATYVERGLGGFRDPNMEKILGLAGRFGPDKRQAVEDSLTEELKTSIDSICANRNNIAHGSRSGITLAQIRSYYANAIKVVGLIEKLFPSSKV